MPRALAALALLATAAAAGGMPQPERPHHNLRVDLHPGEQRLRVVDRIQLPEGAPRELQFTLHEGLEPRTLTPGARLARDPDAGDRGWVPRESWTLTRPEDAQEVVIAYGGRIHHPVSELSGEYARSFAVSPGLIAGHGVFLGGSSAWVPELEGRLSFTLEVHLPSGWRSMSQGRRLEREAGADRDRELWSAKTPQEEVFLVAAPFHEHRSPGPVADAVVLLREDDPSLAERYLGATHRYLQLYEELLGDYPFPKFALVENFWETGYGMPSFTLLGPRVLRFPFILETSYPHEILHSWWGNGVYVDYARGNWSEGLTAYLADHLMKARKGEGARYRRSTLQRYMDYVRAQGDFPLTEFRGRHNAVTEAVGYGKTMMVFHMLRRDLGDDTFTAGLRRLYREHLFETAAWADVQASFEAAAGRGLEGFFRQWVERTGAPELALGEARVEGAGDDGSHRIRVTLEQRHEGQPYRLAVPVAVHLEGMAPHEATLDLEGGAREFMLQVPARPLRLTVDPRFDLFRRLDPAERPPSLGQAFGAGRVTIVLPADAPGGMSRAYGRMAQAWQRGRSRSVTVTTDADLGSLPAEGAVWLLGRENRFLPALEAALAGQRFAAGGDGVEMAGERLPADTRSVVAAARRDGGAPLVWVAAHDAAAVPGLTRKLPHYGKHSYLAFRGSAPENVLKGQWPVLSSPMSVVLADDGMVAAPDLPPRPPLAELP